MCLLNCIIEFMKNFDTWFDTEFQSQIQSIGNPLIRASIHFKLFNFQRETKKEQQFQGRKILKSFFLVCLFASVKKENNSEKLRQILHQNVKLHKLNRQSRKEKLRN